MNPLAHHHHQNLLISWKIYPDEGPRGNLNSAEPLNIPYVQHFFCLWYELTLALLPKDNPCPSSCKVCFQNIILTKGYIRESQLFDQYDIRLLKILNTRKHIQGSVKLCSTTAAKINWEPVSHRTHLAEGMVSSHSHFSSSCSPHRESPPCFLQLANSCSPLEI